MTKVSERERLAIEGVMNALALKVEVNSEKQAWDVYDLAAKLVSYVMKEPMTVKALQKKLAVMVRDGGGGPRPVP
jgi:hypothetical protein